MAKHQIFNIKYLIFDIQIFNIKDFLCAKFLWETKDEQFAAEILLNSLKIQ